ncbi:MAG TPA: hypothetical protein PKE26_09340 [Kiritimatiellia bacterium]|nr:hypothetical protein [Kiritimatiellia bacterium]
MVTWIWRHIAVRLPATWEMLQFSSEFNRGRCAFADRYQFRFELSWKTVKGEPDYDRMVTDYMNRLEHEKKLTEAERARKAGWHGFSGVVNRERTSRFGKYLPEIGCLVEVVFLWPEARDIELENAVLPAISGMPRVEGNRQPWRAFGLDLQVPATAAFEGCIAQPARAEFTFTHPATGNSWQFGRLGMVGSWFKGDLESWLRTSLGRDVGDLRIFHRATRGDDHLHAEGTFKPRRLHLRRGNVRATAWIEHRDGRLYVAKAWIAKPFPDADAPLEELIRAAPEFTPRMP